MSGLFNVKCKNCGAPVGYDILTQSYRCPHCGEISGVEEIREAAQFRKIDRKDRTVQKSVREVLSCPNCGAELFYEEGEESEVCAFCGGKVVRGEFEGSEHFPDYVIPFVLTEDEAKEQLRQWAKTTHAREEGRIVLEHVDELKGWYLPYELVRGPVSGYVLRENVNREFRVRGFIENALVSTSRQLDNETLDAAEPFDLEGLKPFEHGYIAGHRVKLDDLSGAKRERRTLQEAGRELRSQLTGFFHTDGIRVNLFPSDLMEVPVLLPLYLMKIGRRLVVVNGQTGRVAVRTVKEKKRSPLWVLEPLALMALVLLSLYLVVGSLFVALISAIPLIIAIEEQYRTGRFSIFGTVIEQSKQTRAKRENRKLHLEEDSVLEKNPFPNTPVFWELVDGVPTDVRYRFYPLGRVLKVACKAIGLYFLPVLLGAFLHFVCGMGNEFHVIAAVPWFWCFGIFCTVYVFSGIRCDAYERPYTYRMENGRSGGLMGTAKERSLSFFESIGLGRGTLEQPDDKGEMKKKIIVLSLGIFGILLLSTFGMIC